MAKKEFVIKLASRDVHALDVACKKILAVNSKESNILVQVMPVSVIEGLRHGNRKVSVVSTDDKILEKFDSIGLPANVIISLRMVS